MDDILSRIIERKRVEVAALTTVAVRGDWAQRAADLPAPVDFVAALRQGGRMRVIAEMKRASPSAGIIREPYDPVSIAQDYAQHGADALSVLTDGPFFQGSLDHLRQVRAAVNLPILRKDFTLDIVQIHEAKLAGASAILLIAECLSAQQMADYVGVAQTLGLAALVELHDAANLPAALASGSSLIGINNRNLRTFTTDIRHTLDLLPAIPKDRTVVSESGIRTAAEVAELYQAGVAAVLVGESLLRSPSPGVKLAELLRGHPAAVRDQDGR